MAQMLKEITDEQFNHMYQTAHNKWYTDKEFFDIMLKNWYVTQEDYDTLYFDDQWNATQKSKEDEAFSANTNTGSNQNVDNTQWWWYNQVTDDQNKDRAEKQRRQAGWAFMSLSPDKASKVRLVWGTNWALKNWLVNKGMSIMNDSKAMEYLMENFADNAVQIFWKTDPELAKKLVEASKSTTANVQNIATKNWTKAIDVGTRNVAGVLDTETKKKVLGKFLWALAQWIYTDAVMINEVNNENKSWLNKDNWWASALAAVDSATETLPIVSWIDLWLDAYLGDWIWDDDTVDANWESYSKWWLLSKANYLVNNWMWNDSARTFWENDPDKQAEVAAWNKWMEDQWFEWSWFNTWKPSAKKWSKADTMLKNEKAIDKIQGNTAGRWEAATDWVSADREQQNKRDANLYISWMNRSKGKKLDAPDAYTYNNFTNDFYQKDDWTWVNKKTWQDAWSMWRSIKWKKEADDASKEMFQDK